MRTPAKSLTGAIALGATLLASSALYAHDASGPLSAGGSMTSHSMTDSGSGHGMEMMNMTGKRGRMAQNCGAMMSNHGRPPNSQWQPNDKSAPPPRGDRD